MKKIILHLFLMTIAVASFAQKTAHDHYTVSGGLLGAMNFSKFRLDGQNPADISYDTKIGWSAGGWVALPLGRALSLEPEVMYSSYTYRSENSSALIQDGSAKYISIPVLLKLHLGKALAITAGPQVDLVMDAEENPDRNSGFEKDNLTSTSFSLNGGLEVFPHGRAVIFGRYIYGLDNMDNRENASTEAEFKNSNIQIGVKLRLFGKFIPADTDGDGIPDKADNCPIEFGFERYSGCPIPDTDLDGINDELDNCVTVAGLERYNGCPIPDTDGDGINDELDKCVTVAGLERYNGCPIPDTDGDGFNDEADKCPSVAGVAAYNGCPIPDRDMDGVLDPDDKCPDVKGPVDNGGCPKAEIAKYNPQQILFSIGSSTLTAASKTTIKEGAKLLNSDAFKAQKVEVSGHADITGRAESNQALSQKRANTVMAELVKNGVASDRITAVGFGQTMPVGDNKTKEGRSQNRRAVIDAKQ